MNFLEAWLRRRDMKKFNNSVAMKIKELNDHEYDWQEYLE